MWKEGIRNVLQVSELNKSVKERACKEQKSLNGKYEVLRGGDVECGDEVGNVQRYSEGVY